MSNLETLKVQAKKLGLTFHHRAGEDKLRAIIGEYLIENPAKAGLLLDGSPLDTGPTKEEEVWPIDPNAKPLTEAEYHKLLGVVSKKNVGRLRRVRITCMNPLKKNWPGENISVGSAKLGTWKKHIPFNGEPYHIPQIIYDMLKERKCSIFYTVPNPDIRLGKDIRKSKLVNEFAIEDLPPLTPAELKELARKQQLANHGL